MGPLGQKIFPRDQRPSNHKKPIQMPIETIDFKGDEYPLFQTNGFASRFCREFALEVLKGDVIYDIGCNREEWKFPGAIGIDLTYNNGYHAMNLPPLKADGIHSSHFLEHSDNWEECLEYWTSKIKSGGVIFLYLPDYSQTYWRPWNNKKHRHALWPGLLKDYFMASGRYKKIFVSGVDAYNSFTVFAEKI